MWKTAFGLETDREVIISRPILDLWFHFLPIQSDLNFYKKRDIDYLNIFYFLIHHTTTKIYLDFLSFIFRAEPQRFQDTIKPLHNGKQLCLVFFTDLVDKILFKYSLMSGAKGIKALDCNTLI